MVKVILQLYPVIPATRQERIDNRPLGRHAARYQKVVRDWHDVVRAADDMGLWGVGTIEHHFHSEGYEVGPNPGLMDAYWAAITKNIRVGQLGYVMSAQNPLRVAEDTAIIDHLSQGRSFVGFARGYQSRWTNILGQHLGAKATLSPSGLPPEKLAQWTEAERQSRIADDQINRDVFEEQVEMVLQAWTESSIEANGRWQIPFPYDEGIDWTMTATKEMGAIGEMDENNRIRRVSVVPAPLTQPHPPVFVSSNASRETVEYCGRRGFIPTYFSKTERAAEYAAAYVESAAEAGRKVPYGKNQAIVRWGQIEDTEAKARQAVMDYDVDIFRDLYAGTTAMSYDPAAPVDSVLKSGLWVVGDVNQVREQYIATWEQMPSEYVVLIYHFAQQPKESVIRNLELFMEHVKPSLDKICDAAYGEDVA
jgi:alkanesulfonate monooxygenase SsuD/methylene tetrahydromethanopterin reductase-like flavin-dependent oxidoreductase (luciferase family)